MKHFNWLIKLIFYKHRETRATRENTRDNNAFFYDVGYINQVHATLCNIATRNMLYHFGGKPVATMSENPSKFNKPTPTKDHASFDCSTVASTELRDILLQKGPFLLSLPLKHGFKHNVVVLGFARESIVYHDPLSGSNKIMSLAELRALHTEGDDIFIATAKFFDPEKLRSSQRQVLNETPRDILPQKYQRFFTIKKMEDPCKALIDFLTNYAEDSFWPDRRMHKEAVRKFIADFTGTTDLQQLLQALNNRLKDTSLQTEGELYQRMLAIEKIMNIEIFKKENINRSMP